MHKRWSGKSGWPLGIMVFLAVAGPTGYARTNRQIRDGRYLVNKVGMCGDCHTPRNASGRPLAARELQGALIAFRPVHPMPGWAARAPAIAGLPKGWSPAQMIHFLETGLNPAGERARPPMPAFRFRPRDARAVTVYLESLKH